MKYSLSIVAFLLCSVAFGQSNRSTDSIKMPLKSSGGNNEFQKAPIFICKAPRGENTKPPLIIVNGKEVDSLSALNPDEIRTINILKGQEAIKKYGKKASNGVILIELKRNDVPPV